MAIAFVAGTTAEIIKLSPVMRALQDRGVAFEVWSTGFHVKHFDGALVELGLPTPDVELGRSRRRSDVVRVSQVPLWVARVLLTFLRRRRDLQRRLTRGGSRPVLIVHGDTFSTVLGALLGRMLRVDVAHVEAGMRTGKIWHPMPEELNRRIVARMATIHFAPTSHEVEHLRRERVKGTVVDTGANTVVDALRHAIDGILPEVDLPPAFGLVTLHRFELVRNEELFSATMRSLREASREVPLVMPVGLSEQRRMDELGLADLFDEQFRLIEKQPYAQFMPLLARADFVITDSGGLQQECGVLGKPAAIHREAVESQQGIGENLVLTGLDVSALPDFVRNWRQYARPSVLDRYRPTEVILSALEERGVLEPHHS